MKYTILAFTMKMLLVSMLFMAFDFRPVAHAQEYGTIYIRELGSVDPPTAPISNDGNFYYTFTADIIDYQIVVERSNIIIDGADHTLEGVWTDDIGIKLSGVTNVTIKHVNILYHMYAIELDASTYNNISENHIWSNTGGIVLTQSSHNVICDNDMIDAEFVGAIWLYSQSHYNTISRNHILACGYGGISITDSSHNQISDNNITNSYKSGIEVWNGIANTICRNILTNNQPNIALRRFAIGNHIFENNITKAWDYQYPYGVYLAAVYNVSNNDFYHNNFVDNPIQVYDASWENPEYYPSVNTWDDGCEGNYWSDYDGIDSNGDGIGDTPYVIDENNQDNYPLMGIWWNCADINSDGKVDILDIAIGAVAFGSYPGHPRWNCRADINKDQQVNILDVATIAQDFGKTH